MVEKNNSLMGTDLTVEKIYFVNRHHIRQCLHKAIVSQGSNLI